MIGIAKQWGIDPALIGAVDVAEGNLLKAVQCSLPHVTTREEAIEVTCRSATHALCDFIKVGGGDQAAFIAFWGARWAPVGVKNDPTNLNRNWVKNVLTLWTSVV